MKVYKSNWKPCKMVVNFNQKQWRQDIASFIVNKLNWYDARVSRAKKTDDSNEIKEFEIFEVYSEIGHSFKIRFANKNKIISSTNNELVNSYLLSKGIGNNE